VKDGVWHAFLLTPVPDAPTGALMLGGLALLGGAVRRRRKAESRHCIEREGPWPSNREPPLASRSS
jgi:MYXO-CTERM domain-containing protein